MKKSLLLASMAALMLVGGVVGCDNNQTQGDDGMEYEQSKTEGEDAQLSVVGAGTKFAEWDPAKSLQTESCKFTKVSSYEYTFSCEVVVGDTFKVVDGGSWATQYGVEDMDWTKSTTGIVEGEEADYTGNTSNRSNFVMQIAGTLTIKCNPLNFVTGDEKKLVLTVE